MGDQREASVGHQAGAERGGEKEEKDTHSAKQDPQTQPVICCGVSIGHWSIGGGGEGGGGAGAKTREGWGEEKYSTREGVKERGRKKPKI